MSVNSIILLILTIAAYILSLLGFLGVGIIIDDNYVFASKEKRRSMNKKAYQQQSAMSFLGIGTMFLLHLLRRITGVAWLYYIAILVGLVTIVYAIATHYIMKKK